MKKMLLPALILAVLQGNAQTTTPLLEKSFWETKPDVAIVKAELAKGFDFKTVNGMSDPIALATFYGAPNATIKYLIDQPGVDMTHTTVDGRIYLHMASAKANAEIAGYLIEKGANMYFPDSHGITPLVFAAEKGGLSTDLIDVYLKGGLDIHRKYPSKNNANILLLAVPADKDLTITNYLLEKGLSLEATDDEGNTAFDYAAKTGDVNLLKALLEKGVKYTDNALLIAAQAGFFTANKIDVYQYLVDELKINPQVTNKAGQNVLHFITRKQHQADIVRYFLQKDVDINKVDKDGNTPFINAAAGQSFEVIELLFPKVENIHIVNTKGESALLAAVKSGSAETVSLLLDKGADPQIRDKEGNNLAYCLIDSYQGPTESGRGGVGGSGSPASANMPARGADGHNQDYFDHKMKALRAKGLNFTAPQKSGNTLYHMAIAKNDLNLLKKLADLKIDVNAKNKEGETVLHKAAMLASDDTILRYLLSIGADKELANEFGETAYLLAKENELLTANHTSVEFLK